MLHELLLALLGYTGDLVIDEREHLHSLGVALSPDAPVSDERSFRLAPDISFIEPSDRFPLHPWTQSLGSSVDFNKLCLR